MPHRQNIVFPTEKIILEILAEAGFGIVKDGSPDKYWVIPLGKEEIPRGYLERKDIMSNSLPQSWTNSGIPQEKRDHVGIVSRVGKHGYTNLNLIRVGDRVWMRDAQQAIKDVIDAKKSAEHKKYQQEQSGDLNSQRRHSPIHPPPRHTPTKR
jgi:hypothetical protein